MVHIKPDHAFSERSSKGWLRRSTLEISLHQGQPPRIQDPRYHGIIRATAPEARMIFFYARSSLVQKLYSDQEEFIARLTQVVEAWPPEQIVGWRYTIQWYQTREEGDATTALLDCLSVAAEMVARDKEADQSLAIILRRHGLPMSEGSGWIMPTCNEDARWLARDLYRRASHARCFERHNLIARKRSLISLCFGN